MRILRFKRRGMAEVLAFGQVCSLFAYLFANIVAIGYGGTALPILTLFMFFSLFQIFYGNRVLYVRPHMLLFLILLGWAGLRVVIDLGDLEYLKQITIATTGGILLFYLSGSFLRVGFEVMAGRSTTLTFSKVTVTVFIGLLIWVLLEFSRRMHPQYFLLAGLQGDYQRAGNFLSIAFIVASFAYLLQSIGTVIETRTKISRYWWLLIYLTCAIIGLALSQLSGSNSATAVIGGVAIITVMVSWTASSTRTFYLYGLERISLPFSKVVVASLIRYFALGTSLFLILVITVLISSNFDMDRIRLFGYGEGTNISLTSRVEILTSSGSAQMGYAPVFGNMNVAYLTTGNSGLGLHNFFPHVMANLGVFGLMICVALFFLVFLQLFNGMRRSRSDTAFGYRNAMISLAGLFVLSYLLLFANLTTGLTWSVLWFSLGFISQPFGVRPSSKADHSLFKIR